MAAQLEHVNIAVRDARATADVLCGLFGWQVRWQGETPGKGFSVHVGGEGFYLALYTPEHDMTGEADAYHQWGGMNHIGLVVPDLEAAETAVRAAGYTITEHGDYEPGRRFYFDGPDGVEFELVSYGA